MTKLTEKEIADIRNRERTSSVIAQVMTEYPLTYIQVWSILTGRTYRQFPVVTTELPAQVVHHEPKLSIEQMHEITSTAPYWGSQTYFANKFGVSRRTIQRVLDQYGTQLNN